MRLLVGFDGSNGGRDALKLARTMGEPVQASALVVAVIPYGPLPVEFSELDNDAAAEAEPLLAEARERLTGLTVETRGFGGGTPAGVMTGIAEAEDVDLIVIGSPHRGADRPGADRQRRREPPARRPLRRRRRAARLRGRASRALPQDRRRL